MSDKSLMIGFGNLEDTATDHAFEIMRLRAQNRRLERELAEARSGWKDAIGMCEFASEMYEALEGRYAKATAVIVGLVNLIEGWEHLPALDWELRERAERIVGAGVRPAESGECAATEADNTTSPDYDSALGGVADD